MSGSKPDDGKSVRLDLFTNSEFSRGASRLTELCWMAVSGLLVESWLPGSGWRRQILRAFGAQIGKGVIIKPRVRIKFPWRLTVGDHTWIGENVWIDNLATIRIGSHVCLSQAAYLCTGSHNWATENFDLIVRPIDISDHVWVGAKAILAPGTELRTGVVLSMGSLAKGKLQPWSIYSGIPAEQIRPRPRRQTT